MMRSPLQRALDGLEAEFGLWPKSVRRADVGRDGELYLECDQNDVSRWFRSGEGGVVELQPQSDAKIPLARKWAQGELGGEVSVLGWRPGRRLVLCVEGTGTREVHKGARAKGGRRIARLVSAVRGLEDQRPGIAHPRLLSVDVEHESARLSWVDGEPLAVDEREFESWTRVGEGIARLQRAVACDDLPPHGRDEELSVLDRMAARVESATGELPAGWRAARDEVALRLPRCTAPVWTHGDLHDRQLLVSGGGVGLLDLDAPVAGHAAQDLANLTVHLYLRTLQAEVSTEIAAACSRAVLEGAGRVLRDEFVDALRAYQASTLLRLALLYRLRPRWARAADELMVLASRCVDECRV